jgi:hypothetical protein
MSNRFMSLAPWATFVLVSGLSSCAPPPPADQANLTPGTGTIKYRGNPLPRALVSFTPDGNTPAVPAQGLTGEDGRYELTNVRGKKGVAPGDYKVTVSRRLFPDGKEVPPDDTTPPIDSKARESLAPKYSSLETTTLRVTVQSGGGPYDFDLK